MKLGTLFEMPKLSIEKGNGFNSYLAQNKNMDLMFTIDGMSIYQYEESDYNNRKSLNGYKFLIVDNARNDNDQVMVIGELSYEYGSGLFRSASGRSFLAKMNAEYNDEIITVVFVEVDKEYQKRGLVSKLYYALAKYFIIVSDDLQYEDGKNLWKNLAKNMPSNITCVVYDRNDKGKLLHDGIEYNGSNISDSEIWSGSHIRMILMSKSKMKHIESTY